MKKTVVKAIMEAEAKEKKDGQEETKTKTVAIEQVAGIHVFSSDMEKPPIVLIDGEFVDVCAILGFAISEMIDEAVKHGAQRAEIERMIVRTVQHAITISRETAYAKNLEEGEEH